MAFNDDEKPPASNAGNTKGLVTITEPKFSKDAAALSADEVTAVVELKATSSTAVREGLDLVAVLDVSGSMQGDKLQSMKMAMQFVIMKLTPVDRLSVVSFSGSATRHCPLRSVTQQAQADLKAIVDGLVANGGTNIKAGLDTALAIVAGRATTKARTPNVFLMSDGQQSDGDARQVDPGNVAVYTFGFGKDADHALLSDVAKKSPGGTFNSVPDGGNVSAPFSQLLGGLLTIVAQDVQLTLTPKAEDPTAPDLDTMTVAPGTDYTQTTDGDTGVITIKFGTLFSGETRKVAINFKLLESTLTTAYDGLVAEAQHSYTVQGSLQGQTPQDVVIPRSPDAPADPPTSGKAQAVLAEMARRQHAGAIGEARQMADGKNLEEARYKLADAQNALEDIVLNDGEKLVGMLRAELQQLLDLMETQELYEAEGRPYALASETSHGRQRYAARGGDMDAVRLFATPRMDTYLEQAKKFEEDPTAPLPSADDDAKEEMAANPLAAISAPIAFYIKVAIQALQEIEKLVAPPTK
ncbi:hypothetical protein CFC21_055729 [Triticum aestivum]|uniref:VWFA domain-containing protein n=3 Tax=Triticum TaxID=4564 RepID=A0A9R0W607_TRITD|nr:E3 ubiquitin-protein ligase WAV3-like [Triticum dicoccoides]XP_044366734.1 E3 ubiquitin-protein ligase WAV3-like [Triticum aestivum]KAF7046722.1 hypothetical protein CFC21_055729 [Triticum aestivum]VAH99988.1 unnamed protein product [Triticum turgidum subsp. durum]